MERLPFCKVSPPQLTPGGLEVLALAREEAERWQHSMAFTEHLLLGCVLFGKGHVACATTYGNGSPPQEQRMGVGRHHDQLKLLGNKNASQSEGALLRAELAIAGDVHWPQTLDLPE